MAAIYRANGIGDAGAGAAITATAGAGLLTKVSSGMTADGSAGVSPGCAAMPSVLGSKAASPAETVCMLGLKSGRVFRSLSKLHALTPPHVRLQVGFSHLPLPM